MAISFKEVDDKIKKSPLSKEELDIIEHTERVIDSGIKNTFKGGEFYVELGYPKFTYKTSANPSPGNIPDYRKELMFKELERRYKKAGWKCTIQYGEDDGPNRPGTDYWILSGK